jgi:hypothetical protein
MSIFLFPDEPGKGGIRSSLDPLLSADHHLTLQLGKRVLPWDGLIPVRVGDDFYGEPWLISTSIAALDELELFMEQTAKTPEALMRVLERLTEQVEWAVFPWGGNASCGLIGLYHASNAIDNEIAKEAVTEYSDLKAFESRFAGLIARDPTTQFWHEIWKILDGDQKNPIVLTFEYYEGVFDESSRSFSVLATFQGRWGHRLSAYRVQDADAFRHFMEQHNSTDFLTAVAADTSIEHWVEAADLLGTPNSNNVAGAQQLLRKVGWCLQRNAGEIDTNHLLVSARNAAFSRRVLRATSDYAEFVSMF